MLVAGREVVRRASPAGSEEDRARRRGVALSGGSADGAHFGGEGREEAAVQEGVPRAGFPPFVGRRPRLQVHVALNRTCRSNSVRITILIG